jgi:hypothetical protein
LLNFVVPEPLRRVQTEEAKGRAAWREVLPWDHVHRLQGAVDDLLRMPTNSAAIPQRVMDCAVGVHP